MRGVAETLINEVEVVKSNLPNFELEKALTEGSWRQRAYYLWNAAKLKIANQDLSSEEMQQKQRDVMQSSLDFFRFYNSALENLVEGQREVVSNPNFEFQDGSTVNEKTEKLRGLLKKVKSQLNTRHTK